MQPTENGTLISKLAFAQTRLKENVKRYREADQSLRSNGRAPSKLGSNRPNSRLHFKQVLNSCSAFAEAFLKKRNEQRHFSLEKKRRKFLLMLGLASTLCLFAKTLIFREHRYQKNKGSKAKRIPTNTTVRILYLSHWQ